MPVGVYRYGERARRPGLRIGVSRRAPRGTRGEEDNPRGSCFDVWLPILAPSAGLAAALGRGAITLRAFAARYRREMRRPDPRRVIALLAAVSARQQIHLGCSCEDPDRCHRALLAELIAQAAAASEPSRPDTKPHGKALPPHGSFASPACAMPEIPD